jgi:hypothetical protein
VLRRLALGLALARVGLGAVATLSPDVVTRPWVGDEAGNLSSRVLARALGGRDVALGLGALLAARKKAAIEPWVAMAALADIVDTSVTLRMFRMLPHRGRLIVLGSASAAAAIGLVSSLPPRLSPTSQDE